MTAVYNVLFEVVQTFREMGWEEGDIRKQIGGSFHDQFRHSLDPMAYKQGKRLLEQALEDTR